MIRSVISEGRSWSGVTAFFVISVRVGFQSRQCSSKRRGRIGGEVSHARHMCFLYTTPWEQRAGLGTGTLRPRTGRISSSHVAAPRSLSLHESPAILPALANACLLAQTPLAQEALAPIMGERGNRSCRLEQGWALGIICGKGSCPSPPHPGIKPSGAIAGT